MVMPSSPAYAGRVPRRSPKTRYRSKTTSPNDVRMKAACWIKEPPATCSTTQQREYCKQHPRGCMVRFVARPHRVGHAVRTARREARAHNRRRGKADRRAESRDRSGRNDRKYVDADQNRPRTRGRFKRDAFASGFSHTSTGEATVQSFCPAFDGLPGDARFGEGRSHPRIHRVRCALVSQGLVLK